MAFPGRPDPNSEPVVPKVLIWRIEIDRAKVLMGLLPCTGDGRNQGLDFGYVALREQELEFDLRSRYHRIRLRPCKLVGFAMELNSARFFSCHALVLQL